MAKTFTLSALAHNLRRVLLIRCIALAGQWSAVLWGAFAFPDILPLTALVTVLGMMTVFTALSFLRLYWRYPLTELEFLIQLLVDVAGLTVLLYFSGGSTNPFVSYYLVPLTIAAAVLPWRYTWSVALLSVSAYTALLFYYQPLALLAPEHHHHQGSSSLNLHIIGMWFNFFVSSLLITFFVAQMAWALRQRDAELNRHREDELRDEQILAVATLAAGAAHELGTPLSTMKVVLKDLQDDAQAAPFLQDINLLQEQVAACQQRLQALSATAAAATDSHAAPIDVRAFITGMLSRWQLLRQHVPVQLDLPGTLPAVQLRLPSTLEQSLANVLNNAADASPKRIDVSVRWDLQTLTMIVRDYGPGIPADVLPQLGKVFVSTKSDRGLGLGLLLTHATISRYGGTVVRYQADPGTSTELRLPLQEFIV